MKPDKLVIYYMANKVMEIPSPPESIGVGSAHDNELRIVGEAIEPYHLVIRRRGRCWFAFSRSGALFKTSDGKEAKLARLNLREKISVGNYSVEMVPYNDKKENTNEDEKENTTTRKLYSDLSNLSNEIQLEIHHMGLSKIQHLNFSSSKITIGRHTSNMVIVSDKFCSSFHAIIEKTAEGWFIYDTGSKNGTYVDSRRVNGCKLHNGTIIAIGETRIVCKFPDEKNTELQFLPTEGLAKILHTASLFSKTDFPVLLKGESGTGKEIIAHYIHSLSDRRDKPYIPVNCGAIPESLAESLLFGHKKGAFTGALETNEGYIGAADGGTLFLDEIGELPFLIQAKLLRFLDSGMFMQVGETTSKKANVRIISATNRNLIEMIHCGKFREDLFHRLNVLSIEIPPLRERLSDIPQLSKWMLQKFSNSGKWNKIEGISESAIEKLKSHSWPGNVRELRNVLQRAVINSCGGIIQPEHIEFALDNVKNYRKNTPNPESLRNLMDTCNWKIARAAKLSGIPRTTLRYKLKKLGIQRNN